MSTITTENTISSDVNQQTTITDYIDSISQVSPAPQETKQVVTTKDSLPNGRRGVGGKGIPQRGGKGVKKITPSRHRKVVRELIHGITKPSIRRLARRGGVKRIAKEVYDETRYVLKEFIQNIVRDAVTYVEHARRKTVTAMDIVYALKRNGRTIYGFQTY